MTNRKSGAPRNLLLNHTVFLCAAICAALTGCAAPRANPDALIIPPEPGRAVVIGWGNTVGENTRAALTAEKGSRISRLFVLHVDEQKTSFGENIARVPPGEHALTISCGIYIYYQFFTDEKVIRATLDAGHVYRLRSELDGRRCQPFLEDVTGKDG